MAADFEELLEKVGGYGSYQKYLVRLVLIPTSFFIAFTINTVLFQTHVPEHWCHVPGRQNTSYSITEWKNITIPKKLDGQAYESCLSRDIDIVDSRNFTILNTTSDCDFGWDHDDRFFISTIATERQWFCGLEDYSTHIMSITSAGSAVGTIILPILADRMLGRRNMFFISMAIYPVFVLPILFVKNPDWQLFFRFCVGTAFQTNYQMPYLIVLELLPSNMRAVGVVYSFVAWTFSMCLTALIAWLVPYWNYQAAMAVVPSLFSILLWRVLPESPRWLLSKGRLEECTEVIELIAKKNKSDVKREEILKDIVCLYDQQSDGVSYSQLLTYPIILFRLLMLLIISVSTFVVYACVLFNINILPDNYYLNYFILSFIELPSNLIGWLSVSYLGRRASGILLMVFNTVFAIIAIFCFDHKLALLGAVAMLKIFSTDGIYVVFVSTGELLPTPFRSTGMGFMTVGGLIAFAIAPYIVFAYEGTTFEYYVLIGVSLVGLAAAFTIPETIGLPLPQTFEEASVIGKNRPFMSWIHHWNMHRYMPVNTKDDHNT